MDIPYRNRIYYLYEKILIYKVRLLNFIWSIRFPSGLIPCLSSNSSSFILLFYKQHQVPNTYLSIFYYCSPITEVLSLNNQFSINIRILLTQKSQIIFLLHLLSQFSPSISCELDLSMILNYEWVYDIFARVYCFLLLPWFFIVSGLIKVSFFLAIVKKSKNRDKLTSSRSTLFYSRQLWYILLSFLYYIS